MAQMTRYPYEYGGNGVMINISSMTHPTDVYWDSDQNMSSTVMVANPEGNLVTKEGTRVELVSVNGIGEIRWYVGEFSARDAWPKMLEFFGLKEVE